MSEKAITKMQSIVIAAIIIVAAIAGGYYYLTLPKEGEPTDVDTIVFAVPEDALGLDPRRLLLSSENMIVDLMNEGLLRFKIEDGKMTSIVEPALAESYTVSDDGLSYTFVLKQGLEFHDGEPINAAAVKFTWDSFMIKGNPLEPPSGAANWFGGYYGEGFIDGVEAVSAYTVRINLTRRYAPVLSLFAAYYSNPISPKALQELGADGYHNNPKGGAGPYRFVEWVRGDHITLEAYDGYFGGSAKTNRIIFRVIPDSATRYLSIKKGEIDAMYGISPTDLEDAKNNSNLAVLTEPMFATGFIYVNTAKPPLDDVRVRRALAYATDRETLVKELYGDLAVVANELLPQGLWPWDSSFEWYPYDLEMAKSLLAEAGYDAANPLTVELLAYDSVRPYKPAGLEADVALAAQWAKAGIVTNLKVVESGVANADRRSGNYQLHHMGWTMDYADPDNYVGAANSPVKYCGWINTTTWLPVHPDNPLNVEYWELVNDAAESTSHAERVTLYKRGEEILKDQMVIMPICYPNNVIVTLSTVHGLVPPPIYYSWDLMWMNVYKDAS